MKHIFKIGDKKIYSKVVNKNETATFEAGEVHPFYATFALARDAEWACRLFVLEMKEEYAHEDSVTRYKRTKSIHDLADKYYEKYQQEKPL